LKKNTTKKNLRGVSNIRSEYEISFLKSYAHKFLPPKGTITPKKNISKTFVVKTKEKENEKNEKTTNKKNLRGVSNIRRGANGT
jgi:hypothetical protein